MQYRKAFAIEVPLEEQLRIKRFYFNITLLETIAGLKIILKTMSDDICDGL